MEDVLLKNIYDNLLKNKNSTFDNVDKEKIIDYKDLVIDTDKPVLERIKDYLIQNETGYFIKVGSTIVKFEFSDNSRLLAENCIASALTSEITKIS